MNRYEARMKLFGSSQRERNVNKLKQSILAKLPDNPSFKSVKINGEERFLCINTGTQPYYKEFETLPDEDINIGDYVDFANSKWIVATCDSDNEIYKDGKLYQCNYLLKWQSDKGEIIERWAYIASASKYNDGTNDNRYISVGSDQLSIMIPVDEESIKLKKDMSKKFFIDSNTQNPTTYILTGTGNVEDNFNGYGVTSWIVKECAYTPSKDDLKYGVCDYRTPTSSDSDITINEMIVSINGGNILRFDRKRNWTVAFKDKNDNDITFKNWDFVLSIDKDVFEICEKKDNQIILKISNEELIGSSFILQIINNLNKEIIAQNEINIVEGW